MDYRLGILSRSLRGASATWADQLAVEARRRGYDLDGRVYQVAATLADEAGNTATATAITGFRTIGDRVIEDRGSRIEDRGSRDCA